MVVCCYDDNTILIRLIKNRTGNELTSTLEDVFEYLEERGFNPKFYMMDNEAPINTIKNGKKAKNKISTNATRPAHNKSSRKSNKNSKKPHTVRNFFDT